MSTLGLVTAFFRRQFTTLPVPSQDFTGKTVIVTGSNTGLGLACAEHFVRLNASKVILAVRSLPKGQAAAETIAKATSKNVCEVWPLDMADYASIQAFVKRCDSLERLDAVVENAGVQFLRYTEQEGIEMTIRVNVVGTFLLAVGLLPVLRKSGSKHGTVPNLTIVASDVHYAAAFKERLSPSIFTALNSPESNMFDRYNVSKLLEILLVRELASLTSPTTTTTTTNTPSSPPKVILNTVNPGLCHSELQRNGPRILQYLMRGMKALLARSSAVGSANFVYAASGGVDTHGTYMSECVVTEESVFVRSKEGAEVQKRVWDEMSKILEEIQPGILGNI